MKSLRVLVAGLIVFAGAGPAAANPMHWSVGRVVAADLDSITILLDDGTARTLVLAPTTEVIEASGEPYPAAGLAPDDDVGEDCVPLGDERFLARRIILLRPSWEGMHEE